MAKDSFVGADSQNLDLEGALRLLAQALGDFWRWSVEFMQTCFPAFMKLATQMWESWVSLFPRDAVWDPWGAGLVMIFVVLLITHQIQKLLTPA
ncbi:MAG: hypothetical protein KUG61_07735 [Parvibaculaceae bacterium]|nr:hypothetical protein [Parvibaculaceae bacterium]